MLRWKQLPEPGWTARCGPAIASFEEGGGGRVVILGGYDGKRVLRDIWRGSGFDEGVRWRRLADAPWSARQRAAACSLPRGALMLAGGEDEEGQVIQDVWFSPDGGESWKAMPAPEWPGRSGAALVVCLESALMLGGWGNDQHYRDVWRLFKCKAASGWQRLPPPPWAARENTSAICLPNDDVLVLGGFGSKGEELQDMWISHDCGDFWSSLRTPPWPGRGFAAAVTFESGVLLLGGIGDGNRVLGDAWDSNPTCTKWRKLPNPPFQPRAGAAAAKLSAGKALLLAGMDENQKLLKDAWVLDNVEVLSPNHGSPALFSNSKFNVALTKDLELTAHGSSHEIATTLSNSILAFCRREFEVPQTSAMPQALKEQVELKLRKTDAVTEDSAQIYEQAIDPEHRALLMVDAKATMVKHRSWARGATTNTLYLKGNMRYFEATSDKNFQELCERSSPAWTQNSFPLSPQSQAHSPSDSGVNV